MASGTDQLTAEAQAALRDSTLSAQSSYFEQEAEEHGCKGRGRLTPDAVDRAIGSLREVAALIRRVHKIRAVSAAMSPEEFVRLYGEEMYYDALLIAGKPLDAAVAIIRAGREIQTPKQSVFGFDGTYEELLAHNREVERREGTERDSTFTAPRIDAATEPRVGLARARERRPSCATRRRGSRRGALRSCSRGGDSGDSADGDGSGEAGHSTAELADDLIPRRRS